MRSLFICVILSATPALADTLHLSLVKKNSINEYLARMAAPPYQIVLTKEPMESAIESKSLSGESIKEFGIFELEPDQAPPPEAVCIQKVCLAKQSLNQHHNHFHMQEVGRTIRPLPSLSSEANLLGAQSPNIQVSAQELRDLLNKLSGETAVTVNGREQRITERSSSQGRDLARDFLAEEYRRLGYEVSFNEINDGRNRGKNLVAEKRGTDPSKIFIVTAHMDTVRTAGADDDGSGTIGALAVAKALKNINPRHTVRFVAFDLEETGMVGSRVYAQYLSDNGEMERMAGLINLEMTAYDSDNDGAYHVIDCNENTSGQLSAALEGVIADKNLRLTKKNACTNRSDHAIFWSYNRPAVVISQNFFGGDGNPCYHRRCDQVSKLNFDYMAKLTSAVAMTVYGLAQ